ncbi:MAG: SocA family protein [Symploca sp. SIO2G7]|nr:SocA family protein [Symploca sp. SIO2G7]
MKALTVAKYILQSQDQEDPDVTNLKLQKLLYYVQGFFVAKYGITIFDDDIEAWQHGPVVPTVYHQYKTSGNSIIPVPQEAVSLEIDDEQIAFLHEVLGVHSQYSAWALREMTYQELPWKLAFNNGKTISTEFLGDFFRERL